MRGSLYVGSIRSMTVNTNGAQVPCVSFCLSAVFYAFYLNMGCPRLKVIKCSKFKHKQKTGGPHVNFSPNQNGDRGAEITERCSGPEASKHVLINTFIIFLSICRLQT